MFYERIYAEEIQDKGFCCKCSLNADLSLEMKSYHGKDKQFVQRPACFGFPCVCIQTGYIFYHGRHKRAEQTTELEGKDGKNNTRSIHRGQNRVVCWSDSVQTLTIRLGMGVLF